jgi:hypothetical protein
MREQSQTREASDITEWKRRRQIECPRISMETPAVPAPGPEIILPHPGEFYLRDRIRKFPHRDADFRRPNSGRFLWVHDGSWYRPLLENEKWERGIVRFMDPRDFHDPVL